MTTIQTLTSLQPGSSTGSTRHVSTEDSQEESVAVVGSSASETTDVTQTNALPDNQQVAQAMENVKEAVSQISEMARNLQFSIDEETGRTVVKIVDPDTDKVIRQIPSEELLAISQNLATTTGLLVKQKA